MNETITQELEQIRRFSRKALTADEVYLFTLTLCDNEIDRDFERFTDEALQQLAPLFEGKTGIFDHDPASKNQSARIFRTWVETDPEKKTSLGTPYVALRARAYMIRTEENKSLIDEIEGGIKKEVSVGCSMKSVRCSVCGSDRRTAGCMHRPGEVYDGKLCHDVLSEAADAYEWSFVAVPAQRAAGVTKSFKKEAVPTGSIIHLIKSADSDLHLSNQQVQALQTKLAALEDAAEDGKAYRAQLLGDIEKYVQLALPQVKGALFAKGCGTMSVAQLKTMRDQLKAQTATVLPPVVQLRGHNEKSTTDNTPFCI